MRARVSFSMGAGRQNGSRFLRINLFAGNKLGARFSFPSSGYNARCFFFNTWLRKSLECSRGEHFYSVNLMRRWLLLLLKNENCLPLSGDGCLCHREKSRLAPDKAFWIFVLQFELKKKVKCVWKRLLQKRTQSQAAAEQIGAVTVFSFTKQFLLIFYKSEVSVWGIKIEQSYPLS